jgi:arabinofuranan 3-O-arabinosyltransferase
MRVLFWLLILYYAGAQFAAYLSTGGFYSGSHFDTVDFANYWVAAKVVFEGNVLDLFSPHLFNGHLQAAFQADYPGHNWSYPPHFLFFCLPLYLFGFHAAFGVFMAATFLFFGFATRAFVNEYGPSGAPVWRNSLFVMLFAAAVVINLSVAQNGFLISGLLLFGLALMRRRPVLAGLFFGLLTVKPHLGIMIPLILLIDRNRAAFFSAAVTTILLVTASALIFGVDTWAAYLTETTALQARIMTDIQRADIYPLMMMSAFVGVRLLGFSEQASWIVHAGFALPALILALSIYLRETRREVRIGAIVAATFVVSPYSFNYDAGALAVACALLAVAAWNRMDVADMPGDQTLAALRIRLACAAASLPLTSFFAMQIGIPIAPVVLVMFLAGYSSLGFHVAEWWRERSGESGKPASAAGS